MHEIAITETVFRDAQQSLIATRMRTDDMIPMIEKMDQMGYWSFEMWGGATFDAMIRFLNENPWDRIRVFKKYTKNTKLQMLLRGQNLVGYHHYPDDILERFINKAAELGINVFRVFDALNDIRNIEKSITVAKKTGAIVQGAISYTVSPVHSISDFVKFAKNLKELGSDIITIKDMAGLITPRVAGVLVKRLKDEVGLPVALHSHCTTGMAPIAYFEAAKVSVDILDCAISPFSMGTSQPPTETTVTILGDAGFNLKVDKSYFPGVTNYFQKLKDTTYKDLLNPIAERTDAKALLYQIPGGMLSNMISQLKKIGALDKFDKVLKEIPRVRAELGYVPLVTPTSQIIGAQATVNVLTGERYKTIVKEVKDLCKGLYGRTPSPIEPAVMKKVLGTEKPVTGELAGYFKPGWDEARKEMKPYSDKEEDILIYALYPEVASKYFEAQKKSMETEMYKGIANLSKPSPESYPTRKFIIRVDGQEFETEVTEEK